MKLVRIDWIDSHAGNEWKSLDEARREAEKDSALLVRSVGYVVADELDYILLAATWSPGEKSDEDMVNNLMQIPRVAVKDLQPLENREAYDSDTADQPGPSASSLQGLYP